jgi:hypothetical protein
MIVIERMIQKIYPGKWAELEALDKKYNAVETKAGFPVKKRYQSVIGGQDNNTLIIEREWKSLAEMEATYEKVFVDPEYQALAPEGLSIIQSVQLEVFTPLP